MSGKKQHERAHRKDCSCRTTQLSSPPAPKPSNPSTSPALSLSPYNMIIHTNQDSILSAPQPRVSPSNEPLAQIFSSAAPSFSAPQPNNTLSPSAPKIPKYSDSEMIELLSHPAPQTTSPAPSDSQILSIQTTLPT
mmetsp:Transcript_13574/g.21204  ORF Transcript_13574/g.21204 Transcript_13574/m.21204 type:complete len:136 (+) Transcript_13574:166-573(+)